MIIVCREHSMLEVIISYKMTYQIYGQISLPQKRFLSFWIKKILLSQRRMYISPSVLQMENVRKSGLYLWTGLSVSQCRCTGRAGTIFIGAFFSGKMLYIFLGCDYVPESPIVFAH